MNASNPTAWIQVRMIMAEVVTYLSDVKVIASLGPHHLVGTSGQDLKAPSTSLHPADSVMVLRPSSGWASSPASQNIK